MSKVVHGGGVDRAMAELNLPREQILDFSASINPLGVPQEVHVALQAAIGRITDYPELDAESLRQDLAGFHRLPPQYLLPGSGSTELIYLLPRVLQPRRALLLLPCFGEYAPALRFANCQIDTLTLSPESEFRFSIDRVIASLQPDTDLVWLANPGNPSGLGVDPELLLELARQLVGRRLVVDEAFTDFCPELSLLEQVPSRPNLLILRSLTKFYAIPGLRAGYLAGPPADVARLAAAREPWSLSNLAIAAARACLSAERFRQQTLAQIPQLRAQLKEGLEALGIKIFPADANYLLARLPSSVPSAKQLAHQLRSAGILIRCCEDFAPLDDSFFRIAVRDAGKNRRLLDAVASCLDISQ